MKKYDELTEKQQQLALEGEVNRLLKALCEEGLRFNDKENHDTLQKRIDKALRKAEKMRTPWFGYSYIMDDLYCAKRIKAVAAATVENAIYPEFTDPVIIEGIA